MLVLFNYSIMLCPVTTNTTNSFSDTTKTFLAFKTCHGFRRQTVILRHMYTRKQHATYVKCRIISLSGITSFTKNV